MYANGEDARPVRGAVREVHTAAVAATLEYSPDLDGLADPGEVVWAWVPFEEDPDRGKDRPLLVVGRHRRALLALMMTSRTPDRHEVDDCLDWARAAGTGTAGTPTCAWTGCSSWTRTTSGARAPCWNRSGSRWSWTGCDSSAGVRRQASRVTSTVTSNADDGPPE